MVNRLKIITLNCFVWTALVALVEVIVVGKIFDVLALRCLNDRYIQLQGVPNSFAFTAFELCVTALYHNSLLASLNSREYAREGEVKVGEHRAPNNHIVWRDMFVAETNPTRTRTGNIRVSGSSDFAELSTLILLQGNRGHHSDRNRDGSLQ